MWLWYGTNRDNTGKGRIHVALYEEAMSNVAFNKFLTASDVPLAIQISGSKIAWLTSLSKPTVVRALGELRTICSNKVLNGGIKLGGLGKTMEIDELKSGAKRKYKRGRISEGPWVFGIVERGSQKVLLFCVPDRTRDPCSSSHHNTYPTWNCHLLRSIHSVHTTQPARIYPCISQSFQELCWPRQWCTHQYHRRRVGLGEEKVEVDVWYPVWIHTQVLGWVHPVSELRKWPSIWAVAERHCWTVSTAVKLQFQATPLGATTC